MLTSLCFYGRSLVLIFAVIGRDTINMPEIFQVLRFRRFHCNEKSGFHVRACIDHPRRPKGSQLGREKRRDESFTEDGTNKSAFLIPTLFMYWQITFQSSSVFNRNYNFYCARDNFGAWANFKRDKLLTGSSFLLDHPCQNPIIFSFLFYLSYRLRQIFSPVYSTHHGWLTIQTPQEHSQFPLILLVRFSNFPVVD